MIQGSMFKNPPSPDRQIIFHQRSARSMKSYRYVYDQRSRHASITDVRSKQNRLPKKAKSLAPLFRFESSVEHRCLSSGRCETQPNSLWLVLRSAAATLAIRQNDGGHLLVRCCSAGAAICLLPLTSGGCDPLVLNSGVIVCS